MPMNDVDMGVRPDSDEFLDLQTFNVLPLDVDACINDLFSKANSCEKERTYESAVEACQATRTAWVAIHQKFLSDRYELSTEHFTRAKDGMLTCQNALEHVEHFGVGLEPESVLRERVEEKFPLGIRLRIELVGLIAEQGLEAVNQRILEFLACLKRGKSIKR